MKQRLTRDAKEQQQNTGTHHPLKPSGAGNGDLSLIAFLEPKWLTLRWCKDGLVFAANLRHGREVVDELGLTKSKPVLSPATGDGVARCQDDESKLLGEEEEEERLYQRIIAKLN